MTRSLHSSDLKICVDRNARFITIYDDLPECLGRHFISTGQAVLGRKGRPGHHATMLAELAGEVGCVHAV